MSNVTSVMEKLGGNSLLKQSSSTNYVCIMQQQGINVRLTNALLNEDKDMIAKLTQSRRHLCCFINFASPDLTRTSSYRNVMQVNHPLYHDTHMRLIA